MPLDGFRQPNQGDSGGADLTRPALGGKLGECYRDDKPGGHDDALSAGLIGRA